MMDCCAANAYAVDGHATKRWGNNWLSHHIEHRTQFVLPCRDTPSNILTGATRRLQAA
jgi:hypothetical protein